MDTTTAPQIIEHLNKSLTFTPFDTKWIPGTAKFVLSGQTPRAEGTMQIYQLNKTELKMLTEIPKPLGIKCSTFGANASGQSHIAVGDFGGGLSIIDLETSKTTFTAKAHTGIVNAIDAIGGTEVGCGAAEIVTGGRDGCVRVWDPRQPAAVLALEPADKESIVPDCWAVGFGNSYNNEERCLVSGYDNGDIKIFDLRKNMLQWDTNVKNGVCGIEFDRKDILMNKLVATTLEGKIHVYDLRTYHSETGYATLVDTPVKATIWGAKHLPQNRDIFVVQGGNGTLYLYKYNYPAQRSIECADGKMRGIIGNVEKLQDREIAQQPIASLDWSKDKLGLIVCCALDQQVKVVITTKLNLIN
jgi:WD40 repeat protein